VQAVVGNKWIEWLCYRFNCQLCFSAGGSFFLPDTTKNKTDYLEAGDRRIISIRVRGDILFLSKPMSDTLPPV
jgi:hypothetical protein